MHGIDMKMVHARWAKFNGYSLSKVEFIPCDYYVKQLSNVKRSLSDRGTVSAKDW